MKKIKILFIITLLMSVGLGAEIYGSVYRWSDLETVPAMVQVTDLAENQVIHQELLNESGEYSIELEEGNYNFHVWYGNLSSTQNVSISENESRRIDFALTPSPDYIFPVEPLPDYDEYGEILPPEESLIEENVTDPEEEPEPIIGSEEATDMVIYLAVIVFLVMISLTYFLKKRSEAARGADYTSKPDKENRIKSDEEEIVEALKKNNGEAYQSKLREKTGFSASKTSELLTKMEEEGKITREKKGRKKLVRLEE